MKIQNNQQRRGITLLFVVSMIVLFLLMGTTFVILANDHFRASRNRQQVKLYTVDRTAYVHRSFYSLIRGPELENTNSSLRGHDLLSDMYGYGLKATVQSATILNPGRTTYDPTGSPTVPVGVNGYMIQLVLATTTTDHKAAAGQDLDRRYNQNFRTLGLRNLLGDARARSINAALPPDLVGGELSPAGKINYPDVTMRPFSPTNPTGGTNLQAQYLFKPEGHDKDTNQYSPLDVPGYFGGQVLSFIDGQAKGVSARIVDYTVTVDPATDEILRTFIIIPETPLNGQNTPFDDEAINNFGGTGVNTSEVAALGELRLSAPFGGDPAGTLINQPSTILINGKAFSGSGAGSVMTQFNGTDGTRVVGSDGSHRYAVRPNHARHELVSGIWQDAFFDQYTQFIDCVNEPYDAFDLDNVFLAQALGTSVNASFNPIQLAPKHEPENSGTIYENRYSFRPVLQWDNSVDPVESLNSSTANRFFPNVWDNNAINSPPADISGVANWAQPLVNGAVPHQPQSRPLDVDNDFDGILDSVWMDVGHGVIVMPDGRKVKPLVAAMVVDMDSKLNINAHGSIADAASWASLQSGATTSYRPYFESLPADGGYTALNPSHTDGSTHQLLGATSTTAVHANNRNMARGVGMGPADISLAPLLDDYAPLLVGATSLVGQSPITTLPSNRYPVIPGRYGPDRFPGATAFDNVAAFRFLDHPNNGVIAPMVAAVGDRAGNYTTRPMDIHGQHTVGFPFAYETVDDPATPGATIDVPYGMPTSDFRTSSWPPTGPEYFAGAGHPGSSGFLLHNSPYESSLYRGTNQQFDTLFTPDELEALLRPYDVDSQLLNGRLIALGLTPSAHRALVTTDSWEVPALPPSDFTVPERLFEILNRNTGMSHNEVFIHMRGFTEIDNTTGSQFVDYTHSLLPPEVLKGLPMNINRVFGDGLDNDNDYITDEHWDSTEPSLNEALSEIIPLSNSGGTPAVAIDHNNDGNSDREDRFARQHFARHLFVLTWLVSGGDFNPASTPDWDNPAPPDMNGSGAVEEEDVFLLAQWVANVVDYRDADSICTPFEFDFNPWDGWDGVDAQNKPSTDPAIDPTYGDNYEIRNASLTIDIAPYQRSGDRGLVWGLERPELLLTEAMAVHERRYQDLDSSDPEFESLYVPKASVFVEIYNPWATLVNTEKKPVEFYDYSTGSIDLTKLTQITNDPVWRMAFTETRGSDPDNAQSRRVYFVEPSTNVEPTPDANFYYPSVANALSTEVLNPSENAIVVDQIPPNGYAVVGSSGVIDANDEYLTTFGRRTDVTPPGPLPASLNLADTRSIKLVPGTGVRLNKWDDTAQNWVETTRDCVAIPINRRGENGAGDNHSYRSLGMSDPTAGYDSLGTVQKATDAGGNDWDGLIFSAALSDRADDAGLDYPTMNRGGATPVNEPVFRDGVTTAARYVRLQRLANPEAPFDVNKNPYITVDTMPVDLLSFNGLQTATDPNIPAAAYPLALNSHERGEETGNGDSKVLWREDRTRSSVTPEPPTNNDSHFLSELFDESFGEMNETYRVNEPFAWFTWNNRPYVSQYELGNVPMFKAGPAIHPGAGANPPDFAAINDPSQTSAMAEFSLATTQVMQANDFKLKQIFDFIEVLPRFVNSEIGLDVHAFSGESPTPTYASVFNAPINYASRYRYPGKVNINTMTNPDIWELGMMRYWDVPTATLTSVRGDNLRDSTANTPDTGYFGGSNYSVSGYSPVSFMSQDDPIRPDGVGDFFVPRAVHDASDYGGRPDGTILRANGNANLLRQLQAGSYYEGNVGGNRDYAFRNSSVVKLANISTNRSSVFAIWITVGYFEVDEQGRLGAEVGTETGEITRNRGFFIYDRSIPVAYEPGFNHNVERGILVQSIIE